jgi:hypothetical protein
VGYSPDDSRSWKHLFGQPRRRSFDNGTVSNNNFANSHIAANRNVLDIVCLNCCGITKRE